MPYITKDKRAEVDPVIDNLFVEGRSPGELNYIITRILHQVAYSNGGLNYEKANMLTGVLECAKLEFYRTVVAPYENEKRQINGDVLVPTRI